jgi:hypothetical protein
MNHELIRRVEKAARVYLHGHPDGTFEVPERLEGAPIVVGGKGTLDVVPGKTPGTALIAAHSPRNGQWFVEFDPANDLTLGGAVADAISYLLNPKEYTEVFAGRRPS